jgi:transcription initiation factor TFIID TATA-box-binding protein
MTKVVNIVASGHSHREFDTAELADTASLPVTKRTQDGRVYFDFPSVDATVSLSRTGQYLISGATDLETVQDARNALINALRGIGIKIDAESVEHPEISNIVFSGELENISNGVDLGQLVKDLGLDQASYEPEQFSQIVYRPDELDCVILIFSSGKVTITGCKEFETGDKAMELIQSKIQAK